MQGLERCDKHMGFNKDKIRQICLLMVFGALLVLAVIYSDLIFRGIALGFSIATPFLIGGIIAFVLNLPMKAIERLIFGKWKGKLATKLKRPVSMLLAIVFVVLIINLVIITVVPQIRSAATVLGQKIPPFIDDVIVQLRTLSKQYPQLKEQVAALEEAEINWESIVNTAINFLKNGVGSMLTSTVSVASGIIGGVVNVVISFIFGLYILSQKEKLADQGKRVLSAYLSEKANAYVLKVLTLANKNFSKFITGQCLEAVILGTMFVIVMSIFRMPYAVMVGVLIAFTSLIPVVGAFIGCIVGAFLILIENPVLALWFVVLFLILQQIEGNLIYPKVVGNSVGLPSIWVLMAVSLGGSLFGVAGMLFFIPLLSTCYALLRESVNTRNAAKEKAQPKMQQNQRQVKFSHAKAQNAQKQTRNAQKQEQNAQKQTRNAQKQTQNAQKQAQNGTKQTPRASKKVSNDKQ